MVRSTGTHVGVVLAGEHVQAYVPNKLPPNGPPLNMAAFEQANRDAELALAQLNGLSGLAPSVEWLVYGAIRKEALLTSQIEGTQATLIDLFDEEAELGVANADDVEEVVNYLHAFRVVQKHLRSPKGLPISTRLLCDAHRLLLRGVRGADKQPGEIRRSQNWIGGTRPGNAVFVPPPANRLAALLSDLERYVHVERATLPPLVRIGLIHVQFETIHPFLDGNGRIGRLLIGALLEAWGLLQEPLLYISVFFRRHQPEYYRLLSRVRTDGDWEDWTGFFLEAVKAASAEAARSILGVATLINNDRKKVLASSSQSPVAYRLFELLPSMPRFTVERARAALGTSFPTANAAIKALVELDIVSETTGRAKNRSFGYAKYIKLLSE
jgi:Fic family protein